MIRTLTVNTAADTKDLTVLARVKTELGIAGSGSDAELGNLIREASDRINAHCLRPEGFGQEVVTETFRMTASEEVLILSRGDAPGMSRTIATVTEDDVALDADEYLLDGTLLRRLYSDTPGWWAARKVVVAYTAGYSLLQDDPDYLPHDLERACVELVSSFWQSRGRDPNVRSESVDGVAAISYQDPRPGAGGLPKALADALATYRRVVV
jgi:hypothetical protein